MGIRRKNSRKRRRRVLDHLGEEDEDELDDSSVIPEDELSLLINVANMKEV